MQIKSMIVLAALSISWLMATGCGRVDPDTVSQLHGSWIDDTGQAMFVDVDNSHISTKPSGLIGLEIVKAAHSQVELKLTMGDQIAGLACYFETADCLICRDVSYSGPAFRWYRGNELPPGVSAKAQTPEAGGDPGAASSATGSAARENPETRAQEDSQTKPAAGEAAAAPDSNPAEEQQTKNNQGQGGASGQP